MSHSSTEAQPTHVNGIVLQLVAVVELHICMCAQSEGADRQATLHGDYCFQSSNRHMQKCLIPRDWKKFSCHSIEHMQNRSSFTLENNHNRPDVNKEISCNWRYSHSHFTFSVHFIMFYISTTTVLRWKTLHYISDIIFQYFQIIFYN